jgi:TetR/AcrR family transcriptional repressor of nem operon
MRYSEEHKENTRRRVVEAAAKRFRKRGIGAVGVATVMADAGLTHGGFYSHFASKEALAAEAVAHAMDASADSIAAAGGLAAFIHAYLQPAHRDAPEKGCITAALVAEIARHPKSTRAVFTKKLRAFLKSIEAHLPTPDPAVAQAIFATLVGTLQLARAVSDPALSNQILSAGEAAARRLSSLEPAGV